MTRALIADDERLMRDQLRARLGEVWPELEIVAEAKNGLEALELTQQHHPDLVFLDIRMPGMTGVDAARQIAQLPTHTPDMQQLLQRLAAQLNPNAPPKLQWIQATVGQQIQMIPVEDVLFFISDEKYTRVQTATIEALIRKPIKELVDELDMNLFWQIHRSTLVNTKAIAGVSRDLRGRQLVSVKGHPEKLEVSRSFTGLFKGM